jgi:hypothetical protein
MEKATGKKPFPPKIITQFDCLGFENVKNNDEAQQNTSTEVHSRLSVNKYSPIFARKTRLFPPNFTTKLLSPTSAHATLSPVSSTNYSPATFSWGSRVASSIWSQSSVSSPADFELPQLPLEPKAHWFHPAQTGAVLSGAGAQFAGNEEEEEEEEQGRVGLELCNEFEVGDEERFSVIKIVGTSRVIMEDIPEEDPSEHSINELEENYHTELVTRIPPSAPTELPEAVSSATESLEEFALKGMYTFVVV